MTWIRSQLIPCIARELADRGHSPADLFARRGLAWPIEAAMVELPIEDYHELLDELVTRSGEPTLALTLAARRAPGSYGLVEHLLRASSTVEEGLAELARHAHHLDEPVELVWRRRPAGALCGLRASTHRHGLGRHANEFFVRTLLLELARLTGAPMRAQRVFFEHAARAPGLDYAALLGADEVRWDEGMTGVELDEEILARPIRGADPVLLETLRRHFALTPRALAGATSSARIVEVERVREVLRESLDEAAVPTLAEVAARLGTGPRSLQRVLQQRRTSLRVLRARLQMEEAARRLVETEDEIAAIAAALGFHGTSNFSRAFRRWHGENPQAFRRRQR